jgi:hypothetical protein
MTIKIGVTGTRSGMNPRQAAEVRDILVSSFEIGAEFHHGDCKGVDVEAAAIAQELGYIVVGHPPVKTELRGYFNDDETREANGYFERNRDIVNDTQCLITVPWQMEHSDNGGTWYTYDYGIKKEKIVLVVWPEE